MVIFFPGLIFIVAYFLSECWSVKQLRLLIFIFMGIFIFYNTKSILNTYSYFGLKHKNEAVAYALDKVNKNSFYLDSIGSCGTLGYLYLFWHNGQLPTHSLGLMNQLTPTLIPKPVGPQPKLGVVMVSGLGDHTTDFLYKYDSYKKFANESRIFGSIEVLIVDVN